MKYLKLLMSALLLAMPLIGSAQTQQAVLTTTDGQRVVFLLADKPVVTYDGSDVKVSSVNDTVLYPSNQVQKITVEIVEDTPNAINSLKDNETKFTIRNGQILVNGMPASGKVAVYTLDGKTVGESTVGTDGRATLSVPYSHEGIYIIKLNNKSFKIHVK